MPVSAIPGVSHAQRRYRQSLADAPKAGWNEKGKASLPVLACLAMLYAGRAGISQLAANQSRALVEWAALEVYESMRGVPANESQWHEAPNLTYAPSWGTASPTPGPEVNATQSPFRVPDFNATSSPFWSPDWNATDSPSDSPTGTPTVSVVSGTTESPTPAPVTALPNVTGQAGPTQDEKVIDPHTVRKAVLAFAALSVVFDQLYLHPAFADGAALLRKWFQRMPQRPTPEPVTRAFTMGATSITLAAAVQIWHRAEYEDARKLVAVMGSIFGMRGARAIIRDWLQQFPMGQVPGLVARQKGGEPLTVSQKKLHDAIQLVVRLLVYGAMVGWHLARLQPDLRKLWGLTDEDEYSGNDHDFMLFMESIATGSVLAEAVVDASVVAGRWMATKAMGGELHWRTRTMNMFQNTMECLEAMRENGAIRAAGGIFSTDLRAVLDVALKDHKPAATAVQAIMWVATECRSAIKDAGAKESRNAERLDSVIRAASGQHERQAAANGDAWVKDPYERRAAQRDVQVLAQRMFKARGEDGRRLVNQQTDAQIVEKLVDAMQRDVALPVVVHGPEGVVAAATPESPDGDADRLVL